MDTSLPPASSPPANPSQVSPSQASTNDDATPGVVSEDQVKLALRRVKDPDLQLNIVDLGLVYGVRVDGSTVNVDVTLTSPGCPSGPEIFGSIEQEIKTLPGVEQVAVNLIWTPFWTPDRIEPRVRSYLGL
jgi:metal-sulfur cluster biosynthetic enzyme